MQALYLSPKPARKKLHHHNYEGTCLVRSRFSISKSRLSAMHVPCNRCCSTILWSPVTSQQPRNTCNTYWLFIQLFFTCRWTLKYIYFACNYGLQIRVKLSFTSSSFGLGTTLSILHFWSFSRSYCPCSPLLSGCYYDQRIWIPMQFVLPRFIYLHSEKEEHSLNVINTPTTLPCNSV